MKKFLGIFNHTLTEKQKADLQKNWKVEEFYTLPPNLQEKIKKQMM